MVGGVLHKYTAIGGRGREGKERGILDSIQRLSNRNVLSVSVEKETGEETSGGIREDRHVACLSIFCFTGK